MANRIHDLYLEPGFYTFGATDDDALILEVRGILARLYGWNGRSNDIYHTFFNKSRSIQGVLNEFDSYNEYVEAQKRIQYERTHKHA